MVTDLEKCCTTM